MKTFLFRMDCITDLHVGNGEANYSIIDNEVQKDTIPENVPIIHASGVKGALKQYFENIWKEDKEKITKVFGGPTKNEQGKTVTKEGKYKFFNAICIARPLRVSNGNVPYILCGSEEVLKNFSKLLERLGLKYYRHEDYAVDEEFYSNMNIEIEGEKAKFQSSEQLEKLIGKEFAVAKSLEKYDLPVRARNVLDDNGQSENIWYEEYVPHESVFYFEVLVPDADTDCELKFKPDSPVQFGGNASIGNGYAIITRVDEKRAGDKDE